MINHSIINLRLLITVASELGQARVGKASLGEYWVGGTGGKRRKAASRAPMVAGTKIKL